MRTLAALFLMGAAISCCTPAPVDLSPLAVEDQLSVEEDADSLRVYFGGELFCAMIVGTSCDRFSGR